MSEFYFKILSGTHIGAEIPVTPGHYTIGQSDECDIVLSDDNLGTNELVIVISEDGQIQVALEGGETALTRNGQPCEQPLRYQHFDVLSCRQFFFAIGPANEAWPSLTIPTMTETQPESLEPEFDETEDFEALLHEGEHEEGKNDAEDESETETTEETSANNNFMQRLNALINQSKALSPRQVVIYVALIVTLILALTMFFALSPSAPEVTSETQMEPSSLMQAQMIQQAQGLNNLIIEEQMDGDLLVSGYVDNLEEAQDFSQQMQQAQIPFSSQIVALSEMLADAQLTAESMGLTEVSVEADIAPGSIILRGYVPTQAMLDDLTLRLQSDIYGLLSINEQTANRQQRMESLRSMLRSRGLMARSSVMIRGDQLEVRATLLDSNQTQAMQEVIEQFNNQFNAQPEAVFSSGVYDDQNGRSAGNVSLAIRSISLGRVPYVKFEDGTKYLEGAQLNNGYIIEEITLDFIQLRNGNTVVQYRLGGNRGGNSTN